MTPLDDLPADQRAVVELVLRRGRTYDEIGQMLSIDRAGVRERALSALDSLGPQTGVPAPMRALITDYLLGQLPERVGADVARRLGSEPAARAWARVVASELAPMASSPLPPIPSGSDGVTATSGGPTAAEPAREASPAAEAEPVQAASPAEPRQTEPVQRDAPDPQPAAGGRDAPQRRRSSRRGGALLLGLGALVVVIVVLVIVLSSGGKSHPTTSTSASSPASTATGGATTGRTGTTPKSLATVKLTAAASGSKAQGVAEAFLQNGTPYLAIVAIHLAANSHNYYAVWLTNGPSDSRLLGFAPQVSSAGNLQAATALKATDTRYKQMLVTLETTAHPKAPGTTVLQGTFSLKLP